MEPSAGESRIGCAAQSQRFGALHAKCAAPTTRGTGMAAPNVRKVGGYPDGRQGREEVSAQPLVEWDIQRGVLILQPASMHWPSLSLFQEQTVGCKLQTLALERAAVGEHAVLALDRDVLTVLFENEIRPPDQMTPIRYEQINSGPSCIGIEYLAGQIESAALRFRSDPHEHTECDKHRAGEEECSLVPILISSHPGNACDTQNEQEQG